MGQCEKCDFYKKEYDNMHASDVITNEERTHYCIMHKYGITDAVWNGKKECSDYEKKTK